MVENPNKLAELEALFFYYGEPLSIKKIAKFLGLKSAECESMVSEWGEALKNNPERGLMLLRNGELFQLGTKPELKSVSEKLVQDEFKEELTPAGLETLAIVAYLGPIERSKIDYIRGVNSSFTLRSLLMRGLVQRNANPSKGNVYDYDVSFDFLHHVGLSQKGELPDFMRYKNLLNEFETETSGEAAPANTA